MENNMEHTPGRNEEGEKPSPQQMEDTLMNMGEEAKRRLETQTEFEPGEKEAYERTIQTVEAFKKLKALQTIDPNRNN